MRAETLHKLVTGLGFERCILAGGSGGARDSMLTTMLYPEMVTKLVVWNIVGGIYGTFVLGSFYIVPSILAVRGTGMDGVVKIQEWRERIEAIVAREGPPAPCGLVGGHRHRLQAGRAKAIDGDARDRHG